MTHPNTHKDELLHAEPGGHGQQERTRLLRTWILLCMIIWGGAAHALIYPIYNTTDCDVEVTLDLPWFNPCSGLISGIPFGVAAGTTYYATIPDDYDVRRIRIVHSSMPGSPFEWECGDDPFSAKFDSDCERAEHDCSAKPSVRMLLVVINQEFAEVATICQGLPY